MRTWITACCLALVVLSAASMTLTAQDNKPKKLNKQEQQDVNTLVKIVDAVSAGQQQPPADFAVSWEQNHFIKAQDGKTFVPYTLAIDRAKISGDGLAMYVRAVAKQPAATGEDKRDEKKRVEYPWEDIQSFDVPANGRISRALAAPGGEYDLFIALKEKGTGKRNETPKTTVFRRDLTVRSFTDELTTSSVILAKTVEASEVLDAEKQRANPYTFGTMRVVPAIDGKFQKTDELGLVFWIYGVSPAAMQKPDVTIDYNFHQKLAEGEKYFNRTAPQPLNASTLPAEFDLSVGHLLMGTLSVPLASFPPGDYRLEIKVTDKPSGKTVTENVTFSVTA